MKQVTCSGERHPITDGVISGGGFSYRLDFDWATWPEELAGVHVLSAGFDHSGNLYAAIEDKTHPVVVFDGEGSYVRSLGEGLFQKAHSIYVTPQNTLLVADSGSGAHVIREITLDGTLVRDFGTLGQPGNSGYDLNYLEVLRQENRVPDDPAWNKRAAQNARLDSIRRIGMPFCRPCAMIMNRAGDYFAADGYGNAAVHRFAADGGYRISWGGPGNGPGKFRLVHDLRIDALDRVWVADRENSRVQVFTQSGQLLAIVSGGLMRVGSVWCDEQYAYIGELDGGLTIVSLDLETVVQFGCKGSPLHAHGLVGDRAGNLYVSTNKQSPTNNLLRLTRERS